MNSFSLEGAIVQSAHSKLRARIGEAMRPVRVILEEIGNPQEWRIALDKFENDLFQKIRPDAEKQAMAAFIATYEEVANIVNTAKSAASKK